MWEKSLTNTVRLKKLRVEASKGSRGSGGAGGEANNTYPNSIAPSFIKDLKRSRQQNEKIIAMLSLETLGYYSEAKNSQRYPVPLKLFYPSQFNPYEKISQKSNIKINFLCNHKLRMCSVVRLG